MTRIITGLFDARADAERCVEHLTQEYGVDPGEVEIHAAGEENSAGTRPPLAAGLTGRLAALELPRADFHAYAEGVRRGGIVVSARVPEERAERIMDAFEEQGAIDLDEREASWRAEGWAPTPSGTGYTGHDEDIGFATYGQDVVTGRIPKEHHDDTPAGLLGRLEEAALRRGPARARVRSYARQAAPGNAKGRVR